VVCAECSGRLRQIGPFSSSFTPLKMQDPELVNQLKERLPETQGISFAFALRPMFGGR
jgi:hypothetical protein